VPRLCSPGKSWAGQIRRGDVVSGPDIAPTAVINERDVAAVAVRVLTDHAYAGTKHVLTGPQVLSRAGQVQLIGEAIGCPFASRRSPFRSRPVRWMVCCRHWYDDVTHLNVRQRPC
jgi:uncharacterized protein YbjT (DUF2867 family)